MLFRPTVPPDLRRRPGARGSMLITAMLFAIGIAIVLGTYLNLSRTALKVAHRTFFANDAANLAEAGVEEALYSFNLMSAGTATATAWSGWTISGVNAMKTLPTFNRDQNALGIVKVYVSGYDGSDASPYIMAQAVVTPFDGGKPVTRTVQLMLRRHPGTFGVGLIALNGLTMNNTTIADSYVSNPTSSPTGPWSAYPAAGARSNAAVVVLAGPCTINTQIKGNLYLGAGVTAPPASKVTGAIITGVSAVGYTLTVPANPAATEISQSYNLAATMPAALPRATDLPAADGRYYYFTTASLRSCSIAANRNVTIVSTLGMPLTSTTLITLPITSTLHVYLAGAFTMGANTPLNALGYAGALRIYTSTATACTVGDNCQLVAWVHAPNAAFTATGSDARNRLSGYFIAKTITVSNVQNLHYDESLPVNATFEMTRYLDFQSAADRATVAALSGGYLQ